MDLSDYCCFHVRVALPSERRLPSPAISDARKMPRRQAERPPVRLVAGEPREILSPRFRPSACRPPRSFPWATARRPPVRR
jgi:hypothetical protein